MKHIYSSALKEIERSLKDDVPVASCQIEVFRNLFWRAFIGKASADQIAQAKQAWIDRISGSLNKPVSLLNREGRVVGIVPPLASTRGILLDPTGLSSYTYVTNHKPYIKNTGTTLINSAKETVKKNRDESLVEAWRTLYELMGEPIPEEVIPPAVVDGDLEWI